MMNVHSEIVDSGGRRSLRLESHLDIERPAEEVFAYVSDQLNAPKWEHGLSMVVRLTPGPSGVGSGTNSPAFSSAGPGKGTTVP